MWNVVLVDDEKRIVDGLAKLITRISSQFQIVAKFSDSEEAYSWMKKNHGKVDLVITDINMPKLTGLDLVENLRKSEPNLPFIILTGYGEFEYAKRAIKLGIIEFLLKPVDTEELADVMNRLLLNRKFSHEDAVIIRSSLSYEVSFLKNEIESNYQSFSITAVADKLQLNKDYLSRRFKKEIGINVNDYLINIRLQQACRLLTMPERYKIYEICQMDGYEHQVHFSKLFKKKYNITPKDYQKFGSIEPLK